MNFMPAADVRTNVDFCDHMEELATARWDDARPLAQYLLALWQLAQAHKDKDSVIFTDFVKILDEALDEPAPALDLSAVKAAVAQVDEGGYLRWQAIVLSQAAELTRRGAAPAGEDEASAGRRPLWRNTHTMSFLEAASVATFDGWICDEDDQDDEEGQDQGDGCGTGGCGSGGCGSKAAQRPSVAAVKVVRGEEDEEPAVVVESVSWDLFSEFLVAGQMME